MFSKFHLSTVLFTLVVALPLFAKTVDQKAINFPIKADKLLNGEIHFFFTILSPRKLAVQYPDIFHLDSLSLAQESDVAMMVNKSVYVVNKPVGFFDDKELLKEKYVAHISGEQKVKKLSADTFKITVPGVEGYHYKLRMFFDADDVSTLPNSKVIRAVDAVKQLDVISKSASTIMFAEKTEFSHYAEGGVSTSSFIPLNERKTLVITYNIYAMQRKFAREQDLKEAFLNEIEAVKSLQDSYE
jgi:hypothetical protein